jgi:hypothetical protein
VLADGHGNNFETVIRDAWQRRRDRITNNAERKDQHRLTEIRLVSPDALQQLSPLPDGKRQLGTGRIFRVPEQYRRRAIGDFDAVTLISTVPAPAPLNRKVPLRLNIHQRSSARQPKVSANQTVAPSQQRSESIKPQPLGQSCQDYKRFCFDRLRQIVVDLMIESSASLTDDAIAFTESRETFDSRKNSFV